MITWTRTRTYKQADRQKEGPKKKNKADQIKEKQASKQTNKKENQ